MEKKLKYGGCLGPRCSNKIKMTKKINIVNE